MILKRKLLVTVVFYKYSCSTIYNQCTYFNC